MRLFTGLSQITGAVLVLWTCSCGTTTTTKTNMPADIERIESFAKEVLDARRVFGDSALLQHTTTDFGPDSGKAVLNGMGKVFGSFKGYSIEKSVVEVTQYGDQYSLVGEILLRTQYDKVECDESLDIRGDKNGLKISGLSSYIRVPEDSIPVPQLHNPPTTIANASMGTARMPRALSILELEWNT